MSRTTLPNRRSHETVRFEHWGQRYIVGLGRAHGSAPIQEVFINCAKSGTQAETLARDSAVLLSLALQHGVPIETISHAITRNSDGTPSGPIGALVDLMGEPA
ncbi:hypothetical protein [Bradyrhizobium prioriisuperbiae]|uniref:TSCPD domain-containing protein n=1 Tax=Bradyrhizobium prioriisuperbiae TaxID=2854389 RepID=UPI0028E94E0A|nr:hypothetical protein [Bradyrhizobium prioritasuperba]